MHEVTNQGNLTQKSGILKPNVLITSYEVYKQDCNTVFKYIPFLYIIIDEAHRLKNKEAKILNLLKEHPTWEILLLTGTPIQNNTSELFTLLNYIEPVKFADEAAFMAKYGDLKTSE